MKKTLKAIILSILCVFIMTPMTVQAEVFDLNDTDLTIEIDESRWYVFSRDEIEGNEELTYLGIDHDYMANYMQTENIYLDCIIFFGDREHYIELLVKKTLNDSVNNYANFEPEALMDIAEPIAAELGTSDYEVYENDYKYIEFFYETEGLYCYDYQTVVNGENYIITVQKPYPYEDSDLEMIKAAVDSATYTIDPEKAEEEPMVVLPDFSFTDIVKAVLGIAALLVVIFGCIKWGAHKRLSRENGQLYKEISEEYGSEAFADGEEEFCFVGGALRREFPKKDLKKLFASYIELHKTYTDSREDAYGTFRYACDHFAELEEEEIYSMIALLMLSADRMKRYEDYSAERIEPFKKNAIAKIKAVETIAMQEQDFDASDEKCLGDSNHPIPVAGVMGIERYLGSLAADDGTELKYVYKGTMYVRDKDLDIEYDLRKYALVDAVSNGEMFGLWFNIYSTEDCNICIDGFSFKEGVFAQEGDLPEQEPVEDVCELEPPACVSVKNVPSLGKPRITWSGVEGADKFYVYRALSKDGTYAYVGSSDETEYIDFRAEVGIRYYYKVKAADTANEHGRSQLSEFSFVICDLPCPVVTAETDEETGRIKLTWDVVEGAMEYEIYRATGDEEDYRKMFVQKRTSYVNVALIEPGNTYHYKVRAVHHKKNATSAFSEVVSMYYDPPIEEEVESEVEMEQKPADEAAKAESKHLQ